MANRPDDELILHFYGEHDAPDEMERELAADPELARRYERLRGELAALDRLKGPEPRPGLEGRIWERIAPELSRSPSRLAWRTGWLSWAAAAAAAAVIAFGGFLAGRTLRTEPTETTVAHGLKGLPPEARERVLHAALADHLESSQRLLLEVANGVPPFAAERSAAAELLSANRLYRRAAERAGDRRVAAVLSELELLLTDLAHDGEGSDPRVESEDLLFKVRIARNNLKGFS